MHQIASLFAYIGPETIVPATSALAAIGGILLAFGRSATRPVVAGLFWLIGKKGAAANAAVPSSESSSAAATSAEQS